MSRSYRKNAVFKDREKTKIKREMPKIYANRAVRRSEVEGGPGAYKKVYSGELHDTRIVASGGENELRREWDNGDEWLHERYETFEEALMDWKRSFVMK